MSHSITKSYSFQIGLIMFYFWLFFEGFVGLSYQLLTLRQLTPVVGRSDHVTALVIGIFLGAMSLGYKYGGKKVDFPLLSLSKNLIVSSIIACFFMSSMTIQLFFFFMGENNVPRTVTIVSYCLLTIGPIAFLIGQSLPLLLQKSDWGKETAEKGGNALFLSTVGSVAGAIIPSSFLYPVIGASLTLSLVSGLVVIATFSLLFKENKLLIIGGIIGVIFSLSPFILHKDNVFTSTAHSDIFLIKKEKENLMFANGLVMSSQDHEGNNTAEYISSFQNKLVQEQIKEKNILVLGAGGFMAHTVNPNNNKFTYIDVDSKLVDWAIKYFKFNPKEVNVTINDARSFLITQDNDTWPVVLMDTFQYRFSMPEHLMTKGFFELVSKKLTPDGVLAINAVINPQYDTDYAVNLHNTIASVFPICHISPVTHHDIVANVSYWCFNKFSNTTVEKIYKDDINTISKDVWEAGQRLDNL